MQIFQTIDYLRQVAFRLELSNTDSVFEEFLQWVILTQFQNDVNLLFELEHVMESANVRVVQWPC